MLTEYQPMGTAALLGELAAHGWVHHELTAPPRPRLGGVAIVSRLPIAAQPPSRALDQFASRYLSVRLLDGALEIRGIYGLLQKEPHHDYWKAVLTALADDSKRQVLVMGDFNTGASELDAPAKSFFCSEHFGQLPAIDYTDLWRHCAGPGARACSWHGPTNPYRLDHAFGTRAVVKRLKSCEYSHDERESKVSDHSIMMVELD